MLNADKAAPTNNTRDYINVLYQYIFNAPYISGYLELLKMPSDSFEFIRDFLGVLLNCFISLQFI